MKAPFLAGAAFIASGVFVFQLWGWVGAGFWVLLWIIFGLCAFIWQIGESMWS